MMKFRKPTLPNFLYSESYYQSIKRSNNLGFFLGPIYTTLVYFYLGVGSIFYGSLVLFVFFGFTYFQFKKDWHKEYLPYQFVLYFSVYMFLCLQQSMLVHPGDEFTFSIWAMGFIVCCQSYYAAQVSVIFFLIHLANIFAFQMFYTIPVDVAVPYYVFVFFSGIMSMTFNIGYSKFSSVIEKEKEVRDIVINNIIDGLALYNVTKGEIEESNGRFFELIGQSDSTNGTDKFLKFLKGNSINLKLSERGTIKKSVFLNTGECYDIYITDSQLDETIYKVIRIADITNTKYLTSEITRYENRVNRLEKYYEQVFNSSQDLVLILSHEGVILSCNKSVEKYLGWKEVEIEGTYIYDTIDGKKELFNLIRKVPVKGKESPSVEMSFVAKNGNVFSFEVLLSTADFAEEDSVLVSARNITNRKIVERKLQHTVDTYINIMNNIDAAVYHSEAQSLDNRSIKFVSKKIESIFNMSREDFVTGFKSDQYKNQFIEKDYLIVEKAVKLAIETEEPQRISYRVLVDGREKIISEKMYPRKSEDSVFIYGILEDKTEEKELNTRLEDLLDNYTVLLENLPDPAAIFNDGKVVFRNSACRKGGKTDAEVIEFLSHPNIIVNDSEIGYSHFESDGIPYSVKHIPFGDKDGNNVLYLIYESGESANYLNQMQSESQARIFTLENNLLKESHELGSVKSILNALENPILAIHEDRVVFKNSAFDLDFGEFSLVDLEELKNSTRKFSSYKLDSGIQVFEFIPTNNVVSENNQEVMYNALIKASGSLMIWSIGKDYMLTGYNEIFERIFVREFGKGPKVGMDVSNHIKWVTQSADDYERLKRAIDLGWNGVSSDLVLRTSEKLDNRDVELFVSPVVMESGDVVEINFISHDISERISSESKLLESIAEKEVLLKEVHHRVKNNLQVISSILSLQSNFVEDDETREILRDSQNRINSMSFIHESLYQRKSFAGINFSDYLSNLSQNLVRSYGYDNNKQVKLELEIQPEVELSLDQSIPCGLILNEIISNALKYAFNDISDPKITILLSMENQDISFIIADNGSGVDGEIDIENSESLGMQLIHTLVEQLEGNIELISHKGMKYLITFTKES